MPCAGDLPIYVVYDRAVYDTSVVSALDVQLRAVYLIAIFFISVLQNCKLETFIFSLIFHDLQTF